LLPVLVLLDGGNAIGDDGVAEQMLINCIEISTCVPELKLSSGVACSLRVPDADKILTSKVAEAWTPLTVPLT